MILYGIDFVRGQKILNVGMEFLYLLCPMLWWNIIAYLPFLLYFFCFIFVCFDAYDIKHAGLI